MANGRAGCDLPRKGGKWQVHVHVQVQVQVQAQVHENSARVCVYVFVCCKLLSTLLCSTLPCSAQGPGRRPSRKPHAWVAVDFCMIACLVRFRRPARNQDIGQTVALVPDWEWP
jgi:hypothetical protein